VTEESSWKKPTKMVNKGPSKGSPWVQEIDENTGVPYYFNTADGASSWACPDDF
jgi:hypothetical protein